LARQARGLPGGRAAHVLVVGHFGLQPDEAVRCEARADEEPVRQGQPGRSPEDGQGRHRVRHQPRSPGPDQRRHRRYRRRRFGQGCSRVHDLQDRLVHRARCLRRA